MPFLWAIQASHNKCLAASAKVPKVLIENGNLFEEASVGKWLDTWEKDSSSVPH